MKATFRGLGHGAPQILSACHLSDVPAMQLAYLRGCLPTCVPACLRAGLQVCVPACLSASLRCKIHDWLDYITRNGKYFAIYIFFIFRFFSFLTVMF